MAGQLIILPGVSSGASNGGARIDMTTADQIAARMPDLRHLVSARTLKVAVGGGITGRCRNTGAVLTNVGAGASSLTIKQLASRPAIALTSTGVSAAVALPAGSATASYAVVAAVYMGNDSSTSAAVTNWLNTIKGGALLAAAVRSYGAAGGFKPGMTVACGGDGSTPTADIASPPPNAWAIFSVDWNDDTGVVSVSINGGAPVTATKTTKHLVDATTTFTMGYQLSGSGLRDSGIGDLYLFGASQQGSSYGRGRIADLVAALKSHYGIA